MNVRAGSQRRSAKELMLSNCGPREDSWRSPLDSNEIKPVNPKENQPWIFIGRTVPKAEVPILWNLMQRANSLEKTQLTGKDPTHWKRPWCWERLRASGKGNNRGWDCWMASPTQWTWIWANTRRQRRIENPGVLQPLGSQRIRHKVPFINLFIKFKNKCFLLIHWRMSTIFLEFKGRINKIVILGEGNRAGPHKKMCIIIMI